MHEEHTTFPILTVDGVIFQLIDNRLTILLIQRAFEPFRGSWALPGVYIPAKETSKQALERALIQKAGIGLNQITLIEQPHAFDAPQRDPRGYAVTVMYMGLCKQTVPGTHSGMNNEQNPQFLPIIDLPKLAYDHNRIVAFALTQLQSLALTTNAVGALLPKQFTLTRLQTAYEAIFCKPLDKRNFRRKIASLGFLTDSGHIHKDGAHRPAKLYMMITKPGIQSCIPDLT
jgi:8-oxo-dGTP diphosphatase